MNAGELEMQLRAIDMALVAIRKMMSNPERDELQEAAGKMIPTLTVAQEFDVFWNHYPRKVGKQAAFNAFRKAAGHLPRMISAIMVQKESEQWQRDGGQFIPHPATWINQERWSDDPSAYPKAGTVSRTNYNTNIVKGNDSDDNIPM